MLYIRQSISFPSAIFTGGKKNIRKADKPGGEGVGNKTKKKNHKQNLLLWAKTASTEKNTVGTMYSLRLGLDSITPFVGAAMAETINTCVDKQTQGLQFLDRKVLNLGSGFIINLDFQA